MSTQQQLVDRFADEAIACIRYGENKIRHCLDQLSEEQVWWRPREEMNAIGNLLLHVAGNIRQWIISGVGDETDTRTRQAEFDATGPQAKQEVLDRLFATLRDAESVIQNATAEELLAEKRIQGHDVTKMGAIWHSITHFQGHVQEIIGMTRQQLGEEYNFEWAPSTHEEGMP